MSPKNTFLSLLLSSLILSACSSSLAHDWTKIDPNMPEQFKQQHEEKIAKSEDTLKTDAKNLDAQFQIAFSYQQIGEYGKAEDAYLKVLKLDPKDERALNNLADIYEQMEEYELAADSIKKLYVLNQSSFEVISDTIRILLKADMKLNAQEALDNFARKKMGEADPAIGAFISEQKDLIYNYKNKNETK